jgi:hypothetical protein
LSLIHSGFFPVAVVEINKCLLFCQSGASCGFFDVQPMAARPETH